MTGLHHRYALELLHLKHDVDPEQIAWMDRWEAETGFKLPAAFREWYGMTHHGFPINWHPQPESWATEVPWEEGFQPLMFDEGQWYLMLMSVNLDSGRMFLPLDNRDDPPVYIRDGWDDPEAKLQLHTATFSQYIFGWLMEAHGGLLQGETAHLPLSLLGEHPLDRLQEVITFMQRGHVLAAKTLVKRNWLTGVSVWHFLGDGAWAQIEHFDDHTTFTVTGGPLQIPSGTVA